MRFKAQPYEVRCSRCDVSFPVGTRKCIHCGGPTGAPESLFNESSMDPASIQGAGAGVRIEPGARVGTSSEPIVAGRESPFSIGESGLGEDRPNPRELEMPDEPTSLARTLMRSLGGIVWILLLIGFTLARDCGN